MAENDNNEFEEEFEFESEELFDDEAQSTTEEASTSPVAERKKSSFPWLIAAVILGAGGYFGWRFYQTGSGERDVGEIVATPTQTEPVLSEQPNIIEQPQVQLPQMQPPQDDLDAQLEAIAQPSPPPAPVVTEEKPKPTLRKEDVEERVAETKEDIDKSISALKKEVMQVAKTNTDKISAIEKDIELTANKVINVDKSITALQQDIVQLTKILKTMTEQVNELSAAREAYKSQMATRARQAGAEQAAKANTAKGPRVSQHMTIHAIIPGRAWIRTQEGKTLSVSEGEMLGEYGKILKIDAPTGTVITSSGVTIR